MGMDGAAAEVLRYMGRRGQETPESLLGMVEECIALMRGAAEPRHVSLAFDITPCGEGVLLEGAGLALRGKDAARRLDGCVRAVLLAATLGAGADALIRKWERIDVTRALALDACATQMIEAYCGEAERNIRESAARSHLAATKRFSPGYGDLPLDTQPRILGALNAERAIGLTCTEHFILLPAKSVTAVIGLGKRLAPQTDGCGGCDMDCDFRKDESVYECSRLDKK